MPTKRNEVERGRGKAAPARRKFQFAKRGNPNEKTSKPEEHTHHFAHHSCSMGFVLLYTFCIICIDNLILTYKNSPRNAPGLFFIGIFFFFLFRRCGFGRFRYFVCGHRIFCRRSSLADCGSPFLPLLCLQRA